MLFVTCSSGEGGEGVYASSDRQYFSVSWQKQPNILVSSDRKPNICDRGSENLVYSDNEVEFLHGIVQS